METDVAAVLICCASSGEEKPGVCIITSTWLPLVDVPGNDIQNSMERGITPSCWVGQYETDETLGLISCDSHYSLFDSANISLSPVDNDQTHRVCTYNVLYYILCHLSRCV